MDPGEVAGGNAFIISRKLPLITADHWYPGERSISSPINQMKSF
jgi:hypothetical protein